MYDHQYTLHICSPFFVYAQINDSAEFSLFLPVNEKSYLFALAAFLVRFLPVLPECLPVLKFPGTSSRAFLPSLSDSRNIIQEQLDIPCCGSL